MQQMDDDAIQDTVVLGKILRKNTVNGTVYVLHRCSFARIFIYFWRFNDKISKKVSIFLFQEKF